MYTFLFDRRSLGVFLSGLTVVGILVFLAGMLVGLRINLPPEPPRVAEFQPLSTFEGGLMRSASADPLPAPTATPEEGAETGPAALSTGSVVKGSSTGSRADAPTMPSPNNGVVASRMPVRGSESAPGPAIEPESRLEPADLAVAMPTAEPEPRTASSRRFAEPGAYFVQVGAYGVEENAKSQMAVLAAEGFNSYIVPLRTSSGRTLSAVRFGHFAKREDALYEAMRYVEIVPDREAIVRLVG